jgi:hypothetical protein
VPSSKIVYRVPDPDGVGGSVEGSHASFKTAKALGPTPNEQAVANAIQTVGTGALYSAVLLLSAPEARTAFDLSSGEVHASVQSVMLDDSHYVREAVLGRLRQSSFGCAPGPMATLGIGGPMLAGTRAAILRRSARLCCEDERCEFPDQSAPLRAAGSDPPSCCVLWFPRAWPRAAGRTDTQLARPTTRASIMVRKTPGSTATNYLLGGS